MIRGVFFLLPANNLRDMPIASSPPTKPDPFEAYAKVVSTKFRQIFGLLAWETREHEESPEVLP